MLLVREHIGHHLVDAADPARHRFGRRTVVARQHNDAHALSPQGLHGGRGALLDWVGNDQESGGTAVHGSEHHAVAIGTQTLGLLSQPAEVDPDRVKEPPVAQRHQVALNATHHPFAGFGAKVAGLGEAQASLLGTLHDRRRQWVLAAPLQTRSEAQEGVLRQGGSDGRYDGG